MSEAQAKLPWLSAEEDKEFHQLINGLSWEALKWLATIKAHASVLYENNDVDVADMASCIGQNALDLARELARCPSADGSSGSKVGNSP
jgi:hypothetical protein